MRAIKFRGKRIDNGEWIEGYYGKLLDVKTYGDTEKHYIMAQTLTLNNWKQIYFTDHEVIPETVGQYTGLKDRNGKEIYEGDILHHNWNSGHDHMVDTVSFVKWHNASFFVDDQKRSDWMLSMHALADWATVEVIGNIYDNPELLESA